uniref:Protein kinase domain-containing protein n=1 Tax=Chenopodium quinoa TaxID=63459 RepID=A0A803LAL3_CHEQI
MQEEKHKEMSIGSYGSESMAFAAGRRFNDRSFDKSFKHPSGVFSHSDGNYNSNNNSAGNHNAGSYRSQGHGIERCFKLRGYPPGWNVWSNSNSSGSFIQGNNKRVAYLAQGGEIDSDQQLVTDDEVMTPQMAVAQCNKIMNMLVKQHHIQDPISDKRESSKDNSITGNDLFAEVSDLDNTITIPDGSTVIVTQTRNVKISDTITLRNVLYGLHMTKSVHLGDLRHSQYYLEVPQHIDGSNSSIENSNKLVVSHPCNALVALSRSDEAKLWHLSQRAFIAVTSEEQDPTSYLEASKNPNWVAAMAKELEALKANETWQMVRKLRIMSWYCCGLSFQRTNSQVRRPPSDSTLLPATNSQLADSSASSSENKEPNTTERANDDSAPTRKIHEFTFQQLLEATQRFSTECFMDERSFGPVYQGKLRDTGEIVAVELWDQNIRNESPEHKEFLRRLKILSFLNHPNVITLIGYCIEEDQRILVYEYLSLTSSLYRHLHEPYDHNDYTCTTTLIGIGSEGYHAPEYIATGRLTVKADVYSFGVVLLELVTGRKAKDISRPTKEQDLISWIVAIEHLDRNGSRGDSEFDVQAMMLNLLNHPNVINLTGYCTRGNDRFLVHEYLPLGSLDKHLHDRSSLHTPTLDWHTRTRIALGTANALEYLHNKANPPVIYRNLKPCNILLDNDYNAKLSDFSLSKFGPICDKEHVSVRVRGTFGYIAPEYVKRGFLSVKADVYNFGIVLLELLTGRRAVDIIRETKDQELSYWANRMVLKKSKKILELADPLLQGNFPSRSFYQTFAVAAMCLVENLTARPMMSDVVAAISYISSDCNLDNTNNSPLHEA